MPQGYLPYNKSILDGRIKILPSEYKKIKKLYKELKSLRAIGKIYKVNKKTIALIVNNELKKRQSKYNKGRWAIYYDTEKHRKAIKKYRAKKKKNNLTIKLVNSTICNKQ